MNAIQSTYQFSKELAKIAANAEGMQKGMAMISGMFGGSQ